MFFAIGGGNTKCQKNEIFIKIRGLIWLNLLNVIFSGSFESGWIRDPVYAAGRLWVRRHQRRPVCRRASQPHRGCRKGQTFVLLKCIDQAHLKQKMQKAIETMNIWNFLSGCFFGFQDTAMDLMSYLCPELKLFNVETLKQIQTN